MHSNAIKYTALRPSPLRGGGLSQSFVSVSFCNVLRLEKNCLGFEPVIHHELAINPASNSVCRHPGMDCRDPDAMEGKRSEAFWIMEYIRVFHPSGQLRCSKIAPSDFYPPIHGGMTA